MTIPHVEFRIPNLAATETFGRRFGSLLFPGAVIALNGPLGAGKTHLTRAIAEGLEVCNPAVVNSPTFVLIQEYPARIPIYHFDAYRLTGPREFLDLGSDEYLHGDGVCIIEWAEKIDSALPMDHFRIDIEVLGTEERRFVLAAGGPQSAAALASMLESPPLEG